MWFHYWYQKFAKVLKYSRIGGSVLWLFCYCTIISLFASYIGIYSFTTYARAFILELVIMTSNSCLISVETFANALMLVTLRYSKWYSFIRSLLRTFFRYSIPPSVVKTGNFVDIFRLVICLCIYEYNWQHTYLTKVIPSLKKKRCLGSSYHFDAEMKWKKHSYIHPLSKNAWNSWITSSSTLTSELIVMVSPGEGENTTWTDTEINDHGCHLFSKGVYLVKKKNFIFFLARKNMNDLFLPVEIIF